MPKFKMSMRIVSLLMICQIVVNTIFTSIVFANPGYTDNTAPGTIMDLNASIGSPAATSINLNWSASGDDNYLGTADSYIIKMGTSLINDANFNSATTVFNSISPSAALFPESFKINNLTPATTYYFAIKAVDEAGNIGNISNVVSFTTSGNLPTISSISKTSHENSVLSVIDIYGTNFSNGSIVRFTNVDNTININAVYVSDTHIIANIGTGAPVGIYNVKAITSNGSSFAASQNYTITQAINPVPTVTNINPNIGGFNQPTTITIKGSNFNGVSSVKLDDIGNTALTNLQIIDGNTIQAIVPSSIIPGVYNVQVTNNNGTNNISSVKFEVKDLVVINSSISSNINTNKVIDLGDTNTTPTQITISSNGGAGNQNTDRTAEASLIIPANTTVTDSSGNPYFGNINPPTILKPDSSLYSDIDSSGIVIQLGNPDTKISFSNGLLLNLTIESNTSPIIWYLNKTTNKYELAGIDGTRGGINYKKGGTIISKNGNIYEVGLLINHMSSYIVGVKPSITSTQQSGYVGSTITIQGKNFHPNGTLNIGGNNVAISSINTESFSFILDSTIRNFATMIFTNPDGKTATLFNSILINRSNTGGAGGLRTPLKSEDNVVIKPIEDKKDLSEKYVEKLEEEITNIQIKSTVKQYKLYNINVAIKTPEFESAKTNELIEKINIRMINLFRDKSIKYDELKESIDNYNGLLSTIKLYQETKDPGARLLAKDYIAKLTITLDKVKNQSELDDAIGYLKSNGITKYSDRFTFRSEDPITRQEGAKFFAELSNKVTKNRLKSKSYNCSFKDASSFDPSLASSIKEVCELGLMTGNPYGEFMPNKKLTNSEILVILIRAYMGKLDENVNPWYTNYYLKAKELKIIDIDARLGWLDSMIVNRGKTAIYMYRLSKIIENK